MIKRKRYVFIITFICILVVILCVRITGNSKSNIEGKNKSWMKNIPDEKSLSDITIPGVHNAAASKVPLSLFAKCQNNSILDLLNEGYRYLDIRAGVDEEATEKRLILYHNFIPCYKKDGILPQKLTFDDVTKSCYDFLEENPSETIIFMVKYEHGEISVSEFEKLVEKTIEKNSDKWLLTDETPCLKEARGKIVLYRRYEDEATFGSKAGIECIWDEQRDTEAADLNSINDTWNDNGLIVQDMFKLVPNDKWDVFSYTLNNITKMGSTRGNYPVINFLSTAGTKSVGFPRYFAKDLNKRFMNFDLDDGICPQWIIVDFGNEEIADKIINANF